TTTCLTRPTTRIRRPSSRAGASSSTRAESLEVRESLLVMDEGAHLPSGSVTFLFTDVEGSTKLFERHAAAYRAALLRHDEVLRAAVEAHQGHVFETVGDAFYAVFARPPDAVGAALRAQIDLEAEEWGDLGALRIRVGLHTG